MADLRPTALRHRHGWLRLGPLLVGAHADAGLWGIHKTAHVGVRLDLGWLSVSWASRRRRSA